MKEAGGAVGAWQADSVMMAMQTSVKDAFFMRQERALVQGREALSRLQGPSVQNVDSDGPR